MKITIRADSVEIEGYVNAVGRDSRRMTDEWGNGFVEQIQPGTFALALSKNANVDMLLNHRAERKIGSTDEKNLELEEDSIGLHARATVTDPEVVQLARNGKLVGWSFGFYQLDSRAAYDYDAHVERSIVTELDLKEVSIIDDTMLPVYAGTSVHARAEEKDKLITRAMDRDIIRTIERAEEQQAEEDTKEPEPAQEAKAEPEQRAHDYSKYHEIINRLRRK